MATQETPQTGGVWRRRDHSPMGTASTVALGLWFAFFVFWGARGGFTSSVGLGWGLAISNAVLFANSLVATGRHPWPSRVAWGALLLWSVWLLFRAYAS